MNTTPCQDFFCQYSHPIAALAVSQPAWTFTISITPGHIQLIEPANGSKLETTTTPAFRWQSVENAAEYEIQVDDNPDFSSPQYSARQPATSFPIQVPLTQASYAWRVRALNEDGRSGDWSESWSFIISIAPAVPTLSLPADGTQLVINDMPPFSWTPVENAVSYEIQVDGSQNFDSPNIGIRTTTAGYRLTSSLNQGLYYWRVRALNAYDTVSAWSATWRITILLPPAAPILVSPANGFQTGGGNQLTFTWQSVPTAGQYQIQVDNTPNFLSPEFQVSTPMTNATANQYFQSGQYTWRVRAVSPNGIIGAWSEGWNFTVSLPAPIQESPDPHITVIYPPEFEWLGVQNASQYEIQIGEDDRLNSSFTIRTSSTDLTVTTEQGLKNHYQSVCNNDKSHIFTYYWRVRARDSSDKPGFWSMTLPVTIDFGCGVIY